MTKNSTALIDSSSVHINLPAIPVEATSDDVRRNLFELFRDRTGFSEHTWKMLMQVARQWSKWCQEGDRVWFPAQPEDVRDYLLHLQAAGRAVKTITMHLQMLNIIHKRAGLARPSDSNAVSLVMRRIRRENVDAGEQAGQALPFQRRDLDKLRGRLAGTEEITEIRELAFLGLAYNTLLRISEISRIRAKDITRTDEGRIQIRIGRTKTLVSTAGTVKTLSRDVTELVDSWIQASGVMEDPDNYLFCRILKNGVPVLSTQKPLTPRSLEALFESAHARLHGRKKKTDLRYQAWSGHSARVGAAVDMARAGVSVTEIMQAGGWSRVEMVLTYIRNLESEGSAMVRILEGN